MLNMKDVLSSMPRSNAQTLDSFGFFLWVGRNIVCLWSSANVFFKTDDLSAGLFAPVISACNVNKIFLVVLSPGCEKNGWEGSSSRTNTKRASMRSASGGPSKPSCLWSSRTRWTRTELHVKFIWRFSKMLSTCNFYSGFLVKEMYCNSMWGNINSFQ